MKIDECRVKDLGQRQGISYLFLTANGELRWLNIIQCLLRRLFGFYPETHIKNVYADLQKRVQTVPFIPKLHRLLEKIYVSCAKHYPRWKGLEKRSLATSVAKTIKQRLANQKTLQTPVLYECDPNTGASTTIRYDLPDYKAASKDKSPLAALLEADLREDQTDLKTQVQIQKDLPRDVRSMHCSLDQPVEMSPRENTPRAFLQQFNQLMQQQQFSAGHKTVVLHFLSQISRGVVMNAIEGTLPLVQSRDEKRCTHLYPGTKPNQVKLFLNRSADILGDDTSRLATIHYSATICFTSTPRGVEISTELGDFRTDYWQ